MNSVEFLNGVWGLGMLAALAVAAGLYVVALRRGGGPWAFFLFFVGVPAFLTVWYGLGDPIHVVTVVQILETGGLRPVVDVNYFVAPALHATAASFSLVSGLDVRLASYAVSVACGVLTLVFVYMLARFRGSDLASLSLLVGSNAYFLRYFTFKSNLSGLALVSLMFYVVFRRFGGLSSYVVLSLALLALVFMYPLYVAFVAAMFFLSFLYGLIRERRVSVFPLVLLGVAFLGLVAAVSFYSYLGTVVRDVFSQLVNRPVFISAPTGESDVFGYLRFLEGAYGIVAAYRLVYTAAVFFAVLFPLVRLLRRSVDGVELGLSLSMLGLVLLSFVLAGVFFWVFVVLFDLASFIFLVLYGGAAVRRWAVWLIVVFAPLSFAGGFLVQTLTSPLVQIDRPYACLLAAFFEKLGGEPTVVASDKTYFVMLQECFYGVVPFLKVVDLHILPVVLSDPSATVGQFFVMLDQCPWCRAVRYFVVSEDVLYIFSISGADCGRVGQVAVGDIFSGEKFDVWYVE